MKKKDLSLAEEIAVLVEKMGSAEKEDFIQSYIYLIREENPEEVAEQLDWEATSTSVASAKISILIDYLLELDLLEYSSNPGYRLTKEGRRILLHDIPKELWNKYSDRYESIAALGDNKEIVKIARRKYLEKNGANYYG